MKIKIDMRSSFPRRMIFLQRQRTYCKQQKRRLLSRAANERTSFWSLFSGGSFFPTKGLIKCLDVQQLAKKSRLFKLKRHLLVVLPLGKQAGKGAIIQYLEPLFYQHHNLSIFGFTSSSSLPYYHHRLATMEYSDSFSSIENVSRDDETTSAVGDGAASSSESNEDQSIAKGGVTTP